MMVRSILFTQTNTLQQTLDTAGQEGTSGSASQSSSVEVTASAGAGDVMGDATGGVTIDTYAEDIVITSDASELERQDDDRPDEDEDDGGGFGFGFGGFSLDPADGIEIDIDVGGFGPDGEDGGDLSPEDIALLSIQDLILH
ncbi:hypothetical protein ACM64Y_10375 [Novispirillum sp. DQ9]|uniref:hypothetical protein n=1 Tax=Novispirillum sp. DQ9 TaxID=3398612 RepID=UPI003C7B516C